MSALFFLSEGRPKHRPSLPPLPAQTAVIILAAGASQRMGSPKLFLPFSATETFLDHILAVYAPLPCQAIVVLAGSAQTTILSNRPTSASRATMVFNHDPLSDRFSSLMCGLSEVSAGSYVFVQDVDRPFVTDSVLRALLAGRHPTGWTAPYINGRAGHPVLLSPYVVRRLKERPNAVTLRQALRPFERVLVPVTRTHRDLNINTPEEYERHVRSEHLR